MQAMALEVGVLAAGIAGELLPPCHHIHADIYAFIFHT
jgi:hypothetical protein